MDTSKVIRGVVNSGRYTVTAPIVKEDYGLYLQIEGVELPETYQVDFSNSESSGTSVTMIGNADGVLIPSQFISSGKDVFAFLYHVGVDFGRTVFKFRIPNKLRPDRTNEEPTPEQASTIDQAINALNTAVAKTAQDVIDADASAQNASADAERAEEARTDAQNYATQTEQARDDAQTYANNASASATASAQSASQSAQIKADVEDLAEEAQASASASAQSATASANSASQAQGYAQSASASAQSASGYASQADISANTASNKASEASTSAQTATQKATESTQSASNASQSAQTAEQAKTASQTAQGLAESAKDSAIQAKNDAESAKADAESARDEAQQAVASISGALAEKAPVITDTASGAIASFSDGADDLPLKSLVVDINPVQDLHGYDSPWPAGCGKNLYNKDGKDTGNGYENGKYLTSTGSTNLNVAWDISEYIPVSANTQYTLSNVRGYYPSIAYYDTNKTYLSGEVYANATPKTFTTPANTAYVRISVTVATESTVQFEKGSSATSYAPYENICPISGWTEVDVEQSGKNLFDQSSFEWWRFPTIKYVTMPIPNGTYTLSTNMPDRDASARDVFVFAGKVESGASSANNGVSNTRPRTITVTDGHYTIANRNGADVDDYNWQLELGSTATPYEPYTGHSITIDLGQTVYGGKLGVLSGVLTIDRGYKLFNGSEEWVLQSTNSYGICNYRYHDIISEYIGNDNVGAICNRFAPQTSSIAVTQTSGFFLNFSGFLFIRTPSTVASTVDEFKTWLADHNVQLTYALKNPIEIQLTPNQVNSLLGVNNLWADSGDTEVEYRADTKLFIERLTAPDSADMIADANITSGQYFMVGNSLYKATANIANGGQITVGTNCTRVSLAQALNEINV